MSFSQNVRELTDGQLVSIEHPATAAPQLIPQKLEIQVKTQIKSQLLLLEGALSKIKTYRLFAGSLYAEGALVVGDEVWGSVGVNVGTKSSL